MSAWTPVTVNGAVSDVLVTDFGGVLGQTVTLPRDARMRIQMNYSSDAPTLVQIYLAYTGAAAAQAITMLYDSTLQTPTPDQTQYFANFCASVPIDAALLAKSLRITKGASNAILEFATTVMMGPGC